MRRILMLVTVALALVACGEGEPMPDRDVDTLTRWSAAYKPVAADMLATSEALADDQLDAAGTALTRVKPKLGAAEAQVRALQSPAVRETLTDYMRITRRTITAFDAFLAHLRTNPDDRRARIRVQSELRDANQELFDADSKIRDRIFDHADEAQEQRLDQVIPLPAVA
ncbi:hypothetical protein DVA67_016150 [Solirubrobacter sp. CPCC 204708]|uniref:Lipoprotein n=1 Tax=Solirubrobacter deserti TaxID=2282478 RepID=A0ABT4RPG8_9ACTN|nr:hypothetical protein [Solirubrobacter deserti]MBE2317516.1 hypothetical protein [Solirubrobacter deserti]MDA0140308.1 hypothetical protein [Solirubrobacter deserti]